MKGSTLTLLAFAGWCVAFSAVAKHHDEVYATLPDGTPEYCLSSVPDSPSCKAERKANAPEVTRLQKELAALPNPTSPTYLHDLCVQQKSPDISQCMAMMKASQTLVEKGFPSYDIDAYCQKIGDTAGGSYDIELTCRQEEDAAFAWAEANPPNRRTMTYCGRIGAVAGGSYEIFKTCVQQEENAASQL